MLDKNSTLVLRVLKKLSEGNAYKVVTSDEVLSHLNSKYQINLNIISQIIEFLDKEQYINIKFSEKNTYCYSLLPKAKIYLEQEKTRITSQKSNQSISFYLYIMIASFIGTMFSLLIFFYLTF